MLIRKTPWRNESEPVIVIMAVLLLLGTINVFSSSFVLATTSYNNPYYFLIRHAVWLVLGILVCFVCSRINYHRWQGITKWLLVITVLALILVLFAGTVVNGARRWLSFAGFSVQPAEFAKLTGILIASRFLTLMMKREKKIDLLNSMKFDAANGIQTKTAAQLAAALKSDTMTAIVGNKGDTYVAQYVEKLVNKVQALLPDGASVTVNGVTLTENDLNELKTATTTKAAVTALANLIEKFGDLSINDFADPAGQKVTVSYNTRSASANLIINVK